MANNFLMKDSINPTVIKELANRIKIYHKPFDNTLFVKDIINQIKHLELKERINLVTETLNKHLPSNYNRSIDILVKALPEELPNSSREIEGYGEDVLKSIYGFTMVAVSNYTSTYGLDNFDSSMQAIYQITRRFSSEEAARYFLAKYPIKTIKLYKKWLKDPNMHVRRLVSESTRPRLPWTRQLVQYIDDPSPIIPLLDALRDDKELYVRRSVANNLNDISKDNPKVTTDVLKRWNKSNTKEIKWVVKHSLRTLLKEGNTEALNILGFNPKVKIKVSTIKLKVNLIRVGESLDFQAYIDSESSKDEPLMIDFVINHMKANGKLAPKVFKLKTITIKPGEKISVQKKHQFKPISTRKYYSGKHEIQLKINGVLYPVTSFKLNQ